MPEETFTRSMLGPQYLAHKDSSPMFGFGTGTRDQQEKTYISKEHSALSIATRSPGPAVYDKESTLGRNIDHLPSLPIWGFGSADRVRAGHGPFIFDSAQPHACVAACSHAVCAHA